MPKKTPKAPLSDQERILELERRVDELENRVVAQLDRLLEVLDEVDPESGLNLGNVLSLGCRDEEPKAVTISPLNILGTLGIPPWVHRRFKGGE